MSWFGPDWKRFHKMTGYSQTGGKPAPEAAGEVAGNELEPLVTAIAINTGGRSGHSETTDHSVSVNLSVRKGNGRSGFARNHLRPSTRFRPGYAACFDGAVQ